MHAGDAFRGIGINAVAVCAAAGGHTVGDGEHGDHPLLEAVAAVDEALLAPAGVKDRRTLREDQVPVSPLVAQIRERDAHLIVLLGGMR